jgi:hypothetical protein
MLEMTSTLLPLLLPTLVGFAVGYGVRELISRRRRTAARKEFEQKHLEGYS